MKKATSKPTLLDGYEAYYHMVGELAAEQGADAAVPDKDEWLGERGYLDMTTVYRTKQNPTYPGCYFRNLTEELFALVIHSEALTIDAVFDISFALKTELGQVEGFSERYQHIDGMLNAVQAEIHHRLRAAHAVNAALATQEAK